MSQRRNDAPIVTGGKNLKETFNNVVLSSIGNLLRTVISHVINQIHKIRESYEFHMKMHIEFRHLRTIKAIHEHGGLAKAADILNITQSA